LFRIRNAVNLPNPWQKLNAWKRTKIETRRLIFNCYSNGNCRNNSGLSVLVVCAVKKVVTTSGLIQKESRPVMMKMYLWHEKERRFAMTRLLGRHGEYWSTRRRESNTVQK
jgi:hypothetical protein